MIRISHNLLVFPLTSYFVNVVIFLYRKKTLHVFYKLSFFRYRRMFICAFIDYKSSLSRTSGCLDYLCSLSLSFLIFCLSYCFVFVDISSGWFNAKRNGF